MGIMLVDGNSIGYAAQHSNVLLGPDGEEVQSIFQFLRMMRSLRTRWKGYKPIVLWDGYPKHRYEIYPEYKGHRDNITSLAETRSAYKEQKQNIIDGLHHLGIMQAVGPNYEADDLAGFFSRKAEKTTKILLVTGDQDWLQLVDPETNQTTWHDPRRFPGKVVTGKNFQEFTGYKTPLAFLSAKALIGDVSDNIKGVPGIGKKTAQVIFSEFNRVTEMFGYLNNLFKEHGKLEKKMLPESLRRYSKTLFNFYHDKEPKDIFLRNISLMTLKNSYYDDRIAKDVKIIKGKKDMELFYEFCLEYQFLSITKNINGWDIF